MHYERWSCSIYCNFVQNGQVVPSNLAMPDVMLSLSTNIIATASIPRGVFCPCERNESIFDFSKLMSN